MLVVPYQMVNQGDPVAVIQPTDTRARLDLLRSAFELARFRSQPSIAEENALNFERIRVELLRAKSDLAVAKVKLELAEKDLARNTPLYQEKLVSEDVYQLSLSTRDMYLAEIKETTRAVTEIESRLENLRRVGDPLSDEGEDDTGELIGELQRAHDEAASDLTPTTLVAPITGMVGVLYRQQGENIVAGEPLISINSPWSERVVGYLRQPYPVDPQTGMKVLVTTRTHQRKKFWSEIVQVGFHLESITNSLAYLRPGLLMDSGLPIVVALPAEAKVRPGEIVDLLVHNQRTAAEEVVP